MKKIIMLFLFAGLVSCLNAQSYADNAIIVKNPEKSVYYNMSRNDISRVIDRNIDNLLFQFETQYMKEFLSDTALNNQDACGLIQSKVNGITVNTLKKMNQQTKKEFGTYVTIENTNRQIKDYGIYTAYADNLTGNIESTAYLTAWAKFLEGRCGLTTDFNRREYLNQINYHKENFILGDYNNEDRTNTVKVVSYLETYYNEMSKMNTSDPGTRNEKIQNIRYKLANNS